MRWRGRERDGVPDNDGIVTDQDLLDDEADDPLAFLDVEGIG